MRLDDLNPGWVGAGGKGISNADGTPATKRTGIGIGFDCPCCGERNYISFTNPIDGGPAIINPGEPAWQRTGDTFEALTLSPSIHKAKDLGGCGWHGWIRDGEVIP